MQPQWYFKRPFIIISCIFLFPLGIILLWLSKNIKLGWKIVFTCIIAFYGMFVIAATLLPATPEMVAQTRHDDSITHAKDSTDEIGKQQALKQKEVDEANAHADALKKEASEKAIDAFVMSQEFLKKRLKAPATAKFPDYDEQAVHYLGDSIYTVVSYVDAENTYSALLRSGYHCSLKYEGENWSLISISLDNE
jgi:hypothetical protein